jgi:replicative DNA helicase
LTVNCYADDLAAISYVAMERAFVGALMHLPAESVLRLLTPMEPGDFSDPQLAKVIHAVRVLADAGIRPDPVLVVDELRRTGVAPSFVAGTDPAVYVSDLAATVPNPGSASFYRRGVLQPAYRRRVVQAATRLQQVAGTGSLEVLDQVLDLELQELMRYRARCQQVCQ